MPPSRPIQWRDPRQAYLEMMAQQQAMQQQAATSQQPQGGGGLAGFLGGVAKSVADPFAYLLNTAIVNPTKELTAQATGNKEALRNARRESSKEIGLGEDASDLGGALKKWAGNSAQAFATLAPVAKGGLAAKTASTAGTGAAFGGGEALKQEGSTLEDTIQGILTGAGTGAAFGAATGVAGKALGKARGGSKALDTLSTTGQQMEARSGGLGVGAKMSGSSPLGLKDSKQLTALLEREGIKAGNPISRLGAVENRLQKYGAEIDEYLTKANRTLSEAERASIADDFLAAIDKLPNANATIKKNAAQLAENVVNQTTDLKSLVNFRRGLDQDAISYIANPDAATAANQQAAKTLRKVLSDKTNALVPDIKQSNQLYSQLTKARDFLVQGGKSVNNPSGGVIGRVIESGPVQSLESIAGKGVRKSADFANSAVSKVPNINSGTVAKAGTIGALSVPQSQPSEPTTLSDALMQTSTQQSPFQQAAASQAQQSPYTRENLMMDIQRDPQNADKYISYYQSISEIFTPQVSGPDLNNTAITTISDLQTGIDNLGLLDQQIAQSGANAPVFGALRSKNPFDTEAKTLRAEIDRVKQVVGKALEGGVLRKEDEEKYARILPTINDTDAVAAQKINAIRGDLQNKLQTFYSNSVQYGGGGGLTDALMQAQQGGYY